MACFLQLRDRLFDMGGKGLGETLAFGLAQRAIAVGCRHETDPVRTSANGFAVARHLGHQPGVAVIGVVGRNDAHLARRGLGHAQGDVVGLAARAGQDRGGEIGRKVPGQALDIVQDRLVEIPRVRVQRGGLARNRFDHMGMAVPDMGHVVVAVEILLAVDIPQPDTLALHQVDRVVIKGRQVRAEQFPASFNQTGNILGHRLSPSRVRHTIELS